jgi:hypothetical protein
MSSKLKTGRELVAMRKKKRTSCLWCGKKSEPKYRGAKFCSTRCRVAAHRAAKKKK